MVSIRISITEDIERVLEALKSEYPTLTYPELFKLGLSELYQRRELEARKRWAESLPTLELSEEEAASIAEAREEPLSGPYKLDDLLSHLKSNVSD